MRKVSALVGAAGLLLSVSVHADAGLQGLEMDVMDPGETSARATARITMPRMLLPRPAERDLPGLEPEQRTGVAAPQVDDAGAAVAREPSPGADSDAGKDVPAPGTPH